MPSTGTPAFQTSSGTRGVLSPMTDSGPPERMMAFRMSSPGAIRLSQLARLFSEQEEQLSQEKAARRQRRAALFRESWPQSLRRQALSIVYALRPGRIGDLLPMEALLLREALARCPALPDP